MFWNKVHPSSKVQELLSNKLIKRIENRFSFLEHDRALANQAKTMQDLSGFLLHALKELKERIDELRTELSARNFTTRTTLKNDKIDGLKYIINKICQAHRNGKDQELPLEETIKQAKFHYPNLAEAGFGFFPSGWSRTGELLNDLVNESNTDRTISASPSMSYSMV